ncbi:hypothetical protein ROJ8625_00978 [Roseivivax jejudonensis]|uniref:DUF3616 domain-containing protein n=1 Tax=Roseivivax jejudonensis TaxID=1529041 RepID=A0A1X6YL34_9RHOB|nr:DUF3616 domain-containing protein [Roseivivax jejudonensis]SLN23953.1 hypothetical protein ROJ8625_00978 [Roseivivax jejudonensis]
MTEFTPHSTITLSFRHFDDIENVSAAIHEDISSAARCGSSLFVCCDETAGVDRLTPTDDGNWGNHAHFNLGDFIDLPDGPDGEMDIEGLDCDGAWLWITGSHSLKRGKYKPEKHDPETGLAKMAKIKRDPNRYFLARVPLAKRPDGMAPVGRDGDRRAAWIELRKKSSKLLGWLEDDPHLGPTLSVPSKENGFDIEGMVGRGNRVWLGLRGPVLRDQAVILEFEMKVGKDGHLKPRKIENGRRYRKHLVPAGGEGIRDLEVWGDDLLILTGPVTAGDGRADILRWRGFMGARRSGMVPPEQVEQVTEMPYRGPVDHPEGLVMWPEVDGGVLVLYDAPAKERLPAPETIIGDIWTLG